MRALACPCVCVRTRWRAWVRARCVCARVCGAMLDTLEKYGALRQLTWCHRVKLSSLNHPATCLYAIAHARTRAHRCVDGTADLRSCADAVSPSRAACRRPQAPHGLRSCADANVLPRAATTSTSPRAKAVQPATLRSKLQGLGTRRKKRQRTPPRQRPRLRHARAPLANPPLPHATCHSIYSGSGCTVQANTSYCGAGGLLTLHRP